MNDISRCPLGVRCESCGAEAQGKERLAVHTISTTVGVLCLTLCARCARSNVPPPITVGTATRLVDQHQAHLGGAR